MPSFFFEIETGVFPNLNKYKTLTFENTIIASILNAIGEHCLENPQGRSEFIKCMRQGRISYFLFHEKDNLSRHTCRYIQNFIEPAG